MAYNFLGLVNKVCRKVNEVELNSSNFASAIGFYNDAKEAVNNSIRRINQQKFEWPFNHVTYNETLVVGQTRYPFQADAKYVDFNTFRLQRNDTFGNDTKKMELIQYEDYIENYIDSEYNTSDNIHNRPRLIFRGQSQEYGVYPPPDNAYTLTYEYFRLPVDLVAATDVPSVPQAFEHLIFDGAMEDAYMFRADPDNAQISARRFSSGLDKLQKLYIKPMEYMRDTRLLLPVYTNSTTVVT